MKVTGSALLHAAPDAVYAALNDPDVLARTIPGVESLEQVDADRYKMTITAGVAAIKGAYEGEVRLDDQDPPRGCTVKVTGAGASGTVDATVRIALAAEGPATRLEYDADAIVGGMVGGVGQRMLSGVAKKMAGQFFANVDAVVTGAAPPVAAVAEVREAVAAAGRGRVATAPAPFRPVEADRRGSAWMLLAGVAAGAVAALAGTVVGWQIARRGRG